MDLLLIFSMLALGAVLASFLGVIAERVHTGQSWRKGRSRCNSCGVILSGRDLFPILSWVYNRGRCRTCGSKVPVRYVLFEASLALVFLVAVLAFEGVSLLVFLSAVTVLAYIVLYDVRHMLVPLGPAALFIILALIFSLLGTWTITPLVVATLSALVFLALHLLSRGRLMGLGDVPVVFGLALVVGPVNAVDGFLFSFWVGGLVGVGMLLAGWGRKQPIPFVPFLAVGYLLALFLPWSPLF
jgi:prepilin signal peptidase PulO-like enzyme (type II secretory pathway)